MRRLAWENRIGRNNYLELLTNFLQLKKYGECKHLYP